MVHPTYVINRKLAPPGAWDVYIGRPSAWGNPFKIGRDGDRAEVIRKYEAWLRGQPRLMARLPELRGRVLACWCKPLPCHGDVLARLADALPAWCQHCGLTTEAGESECATCLSILNGYRGG